MEIKFKLVDNWQEIAKKSHSMWAVYLGLLVLGGPELLFMVLEHQVVDPYVTGWAGLALLIYGGFGRLWDQGLSKK